MTPLQDVQTSFKDEGAGDEVAVGEPGLDAKDEDPAEEDPTSEKISLPGHQRPSKAAALRNMSFFFLKF
ncbi:hypothetical protein BGZ83_004737 [Gryganskiella cystojenkinii]|nr:hypothetical protein BGZ83_004737 [Gryganskiella cystojenkinii]